MIDRPYEGDREGEPLLDLAPLLGELGKGGAFASIEDLNRALIDSVSKYNSRPQAELGGLSPDEVSGLLSSDWFLGEAFRVEHNLPPAELAGASLLADARTLLDYFATAGPVKETQAKNLPRAVVAELVPRLELAKPREDDAGYPRKSSLNEGDLMWLAVLRATMMRAGLLVRRKGLRISTIGRQLLVPKRTGTLFGLLFRTLFQRIDLRYIDGDPRHAGLQGTLAYSFYKLRETRDWSAAETLASEAWLGSAKDAATDSEAAFGDNRHYAFLYRVLEPLEKFGLLEERRLPTDERWRTIREFRVTALYDRALRFELPTRE